MHWQNDSLLPSSHHSLKKIVVVDLLTGNPQMSNLDPLLSYSWSTTTYIPSLFLLFFFSCLNTPEIQLIQLYENCWSIDRKQPSKKLKLRGPKYNQKLPGEMKRGGINSTRRILKSSNDNKKLLYNYMWICKVLMPIFMRQYEINDTSLKKFKC